MKNVKQKIKIFRKQSTQSADFCTLLDDEQTMKKVFLDESIDSYYKITGQILGEFVNSMKVVVGIDLVTHEKVAIKIIDKNVMDKNMKLIENEINIMSQVSHFNIVDLKAIFYASSGIFIVMEMALGGELFSLVSKNRIPENQIAYMIKQVFQGLEYLHNMGIVHRDLKLENVLIMKKNSMKLKITDFGLSKIYSGELLKTPCGTPFYVAPEILNSMGYGPEVDMWAAGVLLYVMLSGLLPFHSNNSARLFKMIQKCELVFKKPQFDAVSGEAQDLIKNLIILDNKKRFTATRALQHPFITNCTFVELSSPDSLKNNQNFFYLDKNDL